MAKEYIERDAVIIRLLEVSMTDNLYGMGIQQGVDHAIDCLKEVPTADVVEVVHGRWEYLQDDEWRCSNCHTVFNTGGKWIPMTDNFCSECGADMRERRDSNAAD